MASNALPTAGRFRFVASDRTGRPWTTLPADRGVRISGSGSSHKHPKVRAWLAQRPRWHMHFVPTYSSWLNQVERFFGIITDKAIRRGSFKSVKELTRSTRSSASTTKTASRSLGRPQQIQSWKNSPACADELTGQDTSSSLAS